MIKKNYSLVVTVLEKQDSGLEEIYRVESLPNRKALLLRNPGGPLTLVNDVEELLEAINTVKQFGVDNPTEVTPTAKEEGSVPTAMVVEYGVKE